MVAPRHERSRRNPRRQCGRRRGGSSRPCQWERPARARERGAEQRRLHVGVVMCGRRIRGRRGRRGADRQRGPRACPGSDTDTLTSVTCTKAGTCLAAGLALSEQPPPEPNFTVGAVVRISDGQASLSGLFGGPGLPGAPDIVFGLVGIACSDTAHCMAVGTSIFEDGFGDNVLKGAPVFPVQSISPVSMSGVECVRDNWCVADGQWQAPPEQRPVGVAEFVRIGGANGDVFIGPVVGFAKKSDPYAGTCRNGSLEFCQIAGQVGDEGAVFSVVGESSGLTGQWQARAR